MIDLRSDTVTRPTPEMMEASRVSASPFAVQIGVPLTLPDVMTSALGQSVCWKRRWWSGV